MSVRRTCRRYIHDDVYLFSYLCELWPVAHPIIKICLRNNLVGENLFAEYDFIIAIVRHDRVIVVRLCSRRRRRRCARLIAVYTRLNVNIVTTGRVLPRCVIQYATAAAPIPSVVCWYIVPFAAITTVISRQVWSRKTYTIRFTV